MSEPRPICFVDTETTSLHPDREAWEIAIIHRDLAGRDTEHSWFVTHHQDRADPFSLRIGGYWDRFPEAMEPLPGEGPRVVKEPDPVFTGWESAKKVQKLTHDAVIVGAVPSFDMHVLDRLLRGHGLLPTWHYQLVDVEDLASGWLAARGELWVPPCDSDALSRAVGVEPPGEDALHTALGDARWARDLYDKILTTKEKA